MQPRVLEFRMLGTEALRDAVSELELFRIFLEDAERDFHAYRHPSFAKGICIVCIHTAFGMLYELYHEPTKTLMQGPKFNLSTARFEAAVRLLPALEAVTDWTRHDFNESTPVDERLDIWAGLVVLSQMLDQGVFNTQEEPNAPLEATKLVGWASA